MSRIAQRLLFALPAAYAASFVVSASAFAAPATELQVTGNLAPSTEATAIPATIIANNETGAALSSDATEVQPSDWQYSALQTLASKFNCKGAAALNGTAVSRDSFVDSLNSCLATVEPLIAKSSSNVSADELDALRRLTQEFRAELTNIETRVEQVQKRTALAQNSQFSTTTKLKGEVVVGLNGVISNGTNDAAIPGLPAGAPGSNATVSNRARLLLESTFTGKDRLYTRLTASNGAGYGTYKGTVNGATGAVPFVAEGAQTYTAGSNNSFSLDWLAYQFPLGNTNVYAAAFGGLHSDYADTHSPYFQDFTGGSGAISLLAEESPIYKVGGGTGVGVTIPLSSPGSTFLDSVNLSYFGGNGGALGASNSPAKDNGIFNGRNSILAQVNFKPSDKFDFGLTYVRGEHKKGAIFDFGGASPVVGSAFANGGILGIGYNNSNSYGLSAAYKASETLSLNGYVSLTNANGNVGPVNVNADILTYGVGAAFPNIGQPGNLLGLFVGQSPSVTNVNAIANSLGVAGSPFSSSSFHIEGFYKYKLNDNLSITPGLIYLTNPNQIQNSGSLIGTVRSTFTF